MSGSFLGAFIWDAARVPRGWHTLAPDRPVRLSHTGQHCWMHATGLAAPAGPHIARAGDVAVAIIGAVCLRPEHPAAGDVAAYVASCLADRQPIDRVLRQLDGHFALFAYDERTTELAMAVDPQGHEAIYYALQPGGVAWSSHPQRLARANGCVNLDREGLHLFLRIKGVPAPWSLLEGVRKVRPSFVRSVTPDASIEQEYWPLAEVMAQPYEADFATARRELLEQLSSVIVRLVEHDQGTIGVFLSGGLDSTVALALARQAGVPLRAFTGEYAPPGQGEQRYYGQVAAAGLGVPFEALHFSPRDLAAMARDAIARLPEPVADATLLPHLALAQHVAGSTLTVLDGTGADSIFGNSIKIAAEHYRRIYMRAPAWLRARLIEPLTLIWPLSRRWPLTNALRRWNMFRAGSEMPEEQRSMFWTSFIQPPTVARLLRPEWQLGDDMAFRCFDQYRDTATGRLGPIAYLKSMQAWTATHKLRCLEQATGITIRKPYLSPVMIEFGLRLPHEYKVSGRQGKYVLKQAAQGIVPAETLRRRKASFTPPLSSWIRGDWSDLFHEVLSEDAGIFDRIAVAGLLREDVTGWRDWQLELWGVFVLQAWWLAIKRGA